MQRYISILALFLACFVAFLQANATLAPSWENLAKLKLQLEQSPDDLNLNFTYAQMAVTLGDEEAARRAYLHMLAVDPLLHRVKLDLGLLYIRTGKVSDAKLLFSEVLATNPPPEVRMNVEKLLTQANQPFKRHQFNAALNLGYNYDSDANNAATSGAITFNDITIPLDPAFQKQADSQIFAAATLSHRYYFSNPAQDVGMFWNSRATLYRADQATLDEQNIQLAWLQTGPGIEVKPWHMQLGFDMGYQYVTLDGRKYLESPSGELTALYAPSKKLSFIASILYEIRHFSNAPEITTYADRSGHAVQGKLGANYMLNERDILGISVALRRESTRQDYYDNDQLSGFASYTHLFPHDIFTNILLGYRLANYDGPDPLISLAETRKEYEKSIALTLGKTFKKITYSAGYQYRKVDANLQNYEYDNHRLSANVGWSY